MKKIIILNLLLISIGINSCVSIVTSINGREEDEISIRKYNSKTKYKMKFDIIKNDLRIYGVKTNEYTKDTEVFPKDSKTFNLATATASGWTFTISGVIMEIFLNPSLTRAENPVGNPAAVVAALGIMSLDLLLGVVLGNMEKKYSSNKIVEERVLNQYNYKMIIGKKIYNGILDENGTAIIENINLNKDDFEHGNPIVSIFLNNNNVYTEEIAEIKLNSILK